MWELLLAILAFFNVAITPTPTPKALQRVQPNAELSIAGKTFSIYWQEISDLTLVPNFEEQRTSSQIMEQCDYGANGGFYSSTNAPIGLFVADGKEISSFKRNSTLNGIFVSNGEFQITRDPPVSADFAIQSGPYITPNLRIQNDTFARRVLVGRSGTRWYFLAITEKDNSFDGPKLSELPEILAKLEIDEGLNLDGGSASAFYSESGVRLGELTPVGSFFCGK